jgi:hypothetical protein
MLSSDSSRKYDCGIYNIRFNIRIIDYCQKNKLVFTVRFSVRSNRRTHRQCRGTRAAKVHPISEQTKFPKACSLKKKATKNATVDMKVFIRIKWLILSATQGIQEYV